MIPHRHPWRIPRHHHEARRPLVAGRGLDARGQKGLGARVEVEHWQGKGGDTDEVLLEKRAAGA